MTTGATIGSVWWCDIGELDWRDFGDILVIPPCSQKFQKLSFKDSYLHYECYAFISP